MRGYGWFRRSVGIGLAMAGMTGFVLADELLLKSGEKLTGTVVSIKGGKMQFKSASLGTIEIERAKIKTFSTDGEVKVKDGKGVLRRGRAVASQDGIVKFEAVFLSGEAGINKSPVTSFASGEELKIAEIAELNVVADDHTGVWTGDLDASLTGTRSNTNSNEVDVHARAESESDTGRLRLWGWYQYSIHDKEGRDSITKNNYGGGAQYDFKLRDTMYLFVRGEALHDSIREVDRELRFAAGVGKTLYDMNGINFRGEIGAANTDTRYTDGTEKRSEFSGYLAYYLKWRMTDKLYLDHEFTWYPAFGSDRDNSFVAYLGIKYEFEKNWSLGIRLTDEYHSLPAETGTKNKFTYGIYLGYKF